MSDRHEGAARGHKAARRRVAGAAALVAMAFVTAGCSGTGGTLTVRPEVPATPANLIAAVANNSPQLAVDPTDDGFVVMANRVDGPDFGCNLQVSADGGRGWVAANPPKRPPGAEKCYAPEVGFDGEGRLYFLFVGLAGAGNSPVGAFITTSTDRGRSFSAPRKVLGPRRYQVRMAIDPDIGRSGRIHLVWLEARSEPTLGGLAPTPNPIMASYSDDGGKRFSTAVQVSDPDRLRAVAPALALGPDHAVHVVYYDLGEDSRDYQGLDGPTWEGKWSLVLASSTDGGEGFGAGRVVDDDVVPPERVMLIFTMPAPSLAVDRSARIYVGWHDARRGDWDVFVRASSDGGRRWTKPARVNDDAPRGKESHQYLPRLATSPNGRLDVVFYDRRDNIENRGNHVYYASSKDGGRSFSANRRLTRLDSDSTVGYQYAVPSARGMYEFGARLALVSHRSGALAAWTDTRNTAQSQRGQDVFATEIDLGGRGGGVPAWVLPGSAAAAAAAGLSLLVARRRRRPASVADSAVPRAALLASLATVLFVSCGEPAPGFPAGPAVVDVTMREYSFGYDKDIPRGRVVFTAHNAGRRAHKMALVPLAANFPPVREQLRISAEDPSKRIVIETLAAIVEERPGQTGTFAVDLVPGRYGLFCFIVEPDGTDHPRKGMASEFRVK